MEAKCATPFTGDEDDMAIALNIPLILDNVFAHLDHIGDLKSIRLVCKVWNDVGTAALAKKSLLSMHKLFPCCVAVFQPELINTKLVGGLKIEDEYCNCESDDKDSDFNTGVSFNFIAIMPQLSQHLEELDLTVRNGFAVTFMRALVSSPFTKLTNLSISLMDEVQDDLDIDLSRISIRDIALPSLKRIKFSVPFLGFNDETGPPEYTHVQRFQTVLQLVFNSSPNLQEVVIDAASFHPDFSSCPNLKGLRYSYRAAEVEDEGVRHVRNISALNTMLDSVSKSIQELDLDYKNVWEGSILSEASKILFPKMDCLVSLILRAPNAYPLDLRRVSTRLPKLKHLLLGQGWTTTYKVEDVDSSNDRRSFTVTSLTLKEYSHCVVDAKLVEKIVTLFPSVERLDVQLGLGSEVKQEQLDFSKQLVDTLTAWNLNHAKLRISNLCSSEVLLSLLESLSKWNGVMTVELNGGMPSPTLGFSARVQAAFLDCKSWESLEIIGFSLRGSIEDEITRFLVCEKLPIRVITDAPDSDKSWRNISDDETDYSDYSDNSDF